MHFTSLRKTCLLLTSITALPSTFVTAMPTTVLSTRDATESTLFPGGRGNASWTTLSGAQGSVTLNDATLRPNHISEGPAHTYVTGPDGRSSLRSHYPKGSYKPSATPRGGISFYAPGPSGVDLSTAKEAEFAYSVYFPSDFDWVKGGKLPGFCESPVLSCHFLLVISCSQLLPDGGNSDDIAISCSGGRRDAACFSARLMWRAEGKGELYTYLPPYTESAYAANKKQCDFPNSTCNTEYGASIGTGSFDFGAGKWTTVSERVKLNDVGQANGEIELFVEGKSVINIDGLILRDSDEGRIRGLQMQSFFGGECLTTNHLPKPCSTAFQVQPQSGPPPKTRTFTSQTCLSLF